MWVKSWDTYIGCSGKLPTLLSLKVMVAPEKEGVTATYLGGTKVLAFECDLEKTLAVVRKVIREKASMHHIPIHLADVQKPVKAVLPKRTVEQKEAKEHDDGSKLADETEDS